MRAIVQLVEGDPNSLTVSEVSIPEPGYRQILIRVQCASVNRLDLLQAEGKSPVPSGVSPIIGLEVAGTVSAIGDGCSQGFELSEYVAALVSGGGYAEFCVASEQTVFRAIPRLSMTTMCAIPEAFITAYQLCFMVGQIQPGETVLLHAAGSSVGQAAIQLLRRKNCRVFTTARNMTKCEKCLELGATAAYNMATAVKFSELVKEQTEGKGVDAVLDPVGSSYLDENIKALSIDGRLVLYGLLSGGNVTDSSFLGKILSKRISVLPSTLRSRSIEYKESIVNRFSEDPDGLPAIKSGEIRIEVDKTYNFEDVLEAHRYMRANKNIGKIVLLINSVASAINEFEKELKEIEKRNHIGQYSANHK